MIPIVDVNSSDVTLVYPELKANCAPILNGDKTSYIISMCNTADVYITKIIHIKCGLPEKFFHNWLIRPDTVVITSRVYIRNLQKMLLYHFT